MVRRILASLAIILCAGLLEAQTTGDRLDLYFGDWHASPPRITQSSLVERDIFTRGDPQNPLTDDELRRKYRALAQPILREGRTLRIERAITTLTTDHSSLPMLIGELLQSAGP